MEWLSNYFQAMFLEMLKGAANDFFEALSGLTGDVRGLIDVNPGTYDATLFTMIRRISDTAIVPVACLILCYLMTINFIKIIEDKNTYKDMTFMPVFKWILYTTIGIVLVTKTYDIVLAIVKESLNGKDKKTVLSDIKEKLYMKFPYIGEFYMEVVTPPVEDYFK